MMGMEPMQVHHISYSASGLHALWSRFCCPLFIKMFSVFVKNSSCWKLLSPWAVSVSSQTPFLAFDLLILEFWLIQ